MAKSEETIARALARYRKDARTSVEEAEPLTEFFKQQEVRRFLQPIVQGPEEDLKDLFKDALVLVSQARALLENYYVHLPVKVSVHGVDPAKRLIRLEQKLIRVGRDHREALERGQPCEPTPTLLSLHRELIQIFKAARDRHMRYELPEPFAGRWAFLGFDVEVFYENGSHAETDPTEGSLRRRYLASHIVTDKIPEGAEIVRWNGVPIDRAVEIHAETESGSNPSARRARGLALLTLRPMGLSQPPDENHVRVEYVEADQVKTAEVPWLVTPKALPPEPDLDSSDSPRVVAAVDFEGEAVRRIRRLLFDRDSADDATTPPGTEPESFELDPELDSKLPTVFRAGVTHHEGSSFGYLRIFTFTTAEGSTVMFIDELVRLLGELPETGLILDLRDNPGGIVQNAEKMLQLLTPRRIEPARFQFRATAGTLELTRRNVIGAAAWHAPIQRALELGSEYSRGLPVTETSELERLSQVYRGPIVLVVNANSYSAADIFTAGFEDHKVGVILGTDANTGAGGADVWSQERLRQSWPAPAETSPFAELPDGVKMFLPLRRTVRVGAQTGAILEEAGVQIRQRHFMTRRDLLEKNFDLRARASAILARLANKDAAVFTIEVKARTLSRSRRLDILVGSRRIGFVNVLVDGQARNSVVVDENRRARFDLTKEPVRLLELEALSHTGKVLSVRRFDREEVTALLDSQG